METFCEIFSFREALCQKLRFSSRFFVSITRSAREVREYVCVEFVSECVRVCETDLSCHFDSEERERERVCVYLCVCVWICCCSIITKHKRQHERTKVVDS